VTIDRWGSTLDGAPESVAAWNAAWDEFLHFRPDPIATLADANAVDDTFAMGSVFVATYTVLAGSPLDAAGLTAAVEAARQRAREPRELAHVGALDLLVRGDFTAAGERWATIARELEDFAAVRFAHDVFLHVGDDQRRVASSTRAVETWSDGRPGWNFVAGMHSFALNEVGRFDAAEAEGRRALDADPRDLWARHALAHVYEDRSDSQASLALLDQTRDIWSDQELLATHIWWHLALRLLALDDVDRALAVFDARMDSATTPFRLCDMSSLLWRMELGGADVGDRWAALADRWDAVAERHTCGFLDLHATLTFLRDPSHPGGRRWFEGLDARPHGDAEIDAIFAEVVRPLVAAFRARAAGDVVAFHTTLDGLGGSTHRIGGSNAQRALITLTRDRTTT
jgi:tetratricopeptide (TPR) repeat protein